MGIKQQFMGLGFTRGFLSTPFFSNQEQIIPNAVLIRIVNNKNDASGFKVCVAKEEVKRPQWEGQLPLQYRNLEPHCLGELLVIQQFSNAPFCPGSRCFCFHFPTLEYFQKKCLFSHRIQFVFFNCLFSCISNICCRKIINLCIGKRGKLTNNLTTWRPQLIFQLQFCKFLMYTVMYHLRTGITIRWFLGCVSECT